MACYLFVGSKENNQHFLLSSYIRLCLHEAKSNICSLMKLLLLQEI